MLALALLASPVVAATVYVSPAGADANDGKNWATAKKTVTAGLTAAVSGDQVWVAAGTYVECITLKSGVGLYGGFAGTETDLAGRNWKTNIAILDGNEKGSVVTSPSGATTDTRIDGFAIRNGSGTSSNGYSYGGGIYCSSSSPTIVNCAITANMVSNSYGANGGGIYCANSSSPVISNNLIAENAARYGGGGIYCNSSSPTISFNTVSANNGIGVYCESSLSIISNNVIVGNIGGAISCSHLAPSILNNTIIGNGGDVFGGIHCSNASPTISNNTIVGNTGGKVGGVLVASGSSSLISNNIVAFNSSGVSVSEGTPSLRNNCIYNPGGVDYSGMSKGTGDISIDPLLVAANYGQFHLRAGSPCIDAGYDATVQPGWVDMDGAVRVQGSHVDIGADEFDGTTPPFAVTVIRVSPAGNDANDGLSWSSAKRTVQAGINAVSSAGGDVWVAAGVYNERITLKQWTYAYGGFVGTESSCDQRDWAHNVTILDGQAGGSVVTAVAGHRLNGIDGFTIRNGTGTAPSGGYRYGGGVYAAYSSPTIADNIITGNTVVADTCSGGGIYCSSSSPMIINNAVRGNSVLASGVSGRGGGICCMSSVSGTISNNRIEGNTAQRASDGGEGGGLFCDGSQLILNNVITGNAASSGSGISCGNASVYSNTIVCNTSVGLATGGGAIRCASAVLSNNIVAHNSSGIYGWYAQDAQLRNNCVYNPKSFNYVDVNAGTTDISVDPQLTARDYGEMHLAAGSPCIDAGYDVAAPSGSKDMDGEARVQGAHVDIGADEFSGTAPSFMLRIVRVSPTGNDANDGSSWELAKQTVQAGIDAAATTGGDVWVATGTYNQRITLKPFVHVFGGFAGAETDRAQRNWINNLSILDGGAGGSVVTAPFGSGVCTLDGFTVRNGSGYNGGISCTYSSPTISNNRITGNAGCGISCGPSSSALIRNNTIAGNIGQGIRCNSAATIINNLITANAGSGIACYSATSTITNNSIIGNISTDPAGVYWENLAPTITNNIIAFNSSGIGRTSGGNAALRNNCVFNPDGSNYVGTNPGATDIVVDPQLLAMGYGDLHLTATSPCIDAGYDAALQAGWADTDGEARVQGAHVDIGADEFNGATPAYSPTIVRVSPSGNDAYDGSSWASAKQTVQAGINTASTSGGEVWVAAGVYSERIILKPFAYVYGGFAGIENNRDQRNWTNNVTVLDGGKGGSVVSAFCGHHANAIDGFTIRNGSGTGTPTAGYCGGGIYLSSASPTISNNTITGNALFSTCGSNRGGGIYGINSTPLILNNLITGNTVRGSNVGSGCGICCSSFSPLVIRNNIVTGNGGGGGIYCGGSPPIISNNVISGNTGGSGIYAGGTITNNLITGNDNSVGEGGGIYCGGSSTVISRNTIAGNTTKLYGGGVYCSSGSPVISNNIIVGNCAADTTTGWGQGGGIGCNSSTAPIIVNNTVVRNFASGEGGGIWSSSASPTISNTIIAINSSGVYASGGSPTLRNNCVFNPAGYYYSGLSAGSGDISADPKLLATDFGNIHLTADSPCIDAGFDGAVQADWVDLDGQSRIQGTHVDIGADEFDGNVPSFTPTIVRVSPNGNDANDGSSWELAKRTVQAGIDVISSAGGGEVWVAAGTYTERINPKLYVYVYGGFTGTEASRTQRNCTANLTTLDGAGGGSVVSFLPGSGICGVDGFTLRNGTGTLIDSYRYGGGVYCLRALPIVTNNIIRDNTSSSYGGGVYCDRSWATVSNNVIRNNVGQAAGAGVYATFSLAAMTNNRIAANWIKAGSNGSSGGGIYCNSSRGLVANNAMTGNGAGAGGGLSISACPSLVVTNNTITGSHATDGAINCYGAATISNNLVAWNRSGIKCSNGTPALRNNCFFNPDGANYTGASPGTGDISADPQLLATEMGDVHLTAGSPCIDAGLDDAVPATWTDMDGEPRTQGAHVDIGADEFNGATPPYSGTVVRVSPSGNDANDGSSWALAKRTVQSGIDAASSVGGEVWVAAGIYNECINLRPWVSLFGGFAGTENEREQRSWAVNRTVLDGQRGGSVVTVSAGYRLSRIDGFTIRGGRAAAGGGVNCGLASPVIANNMITGNMVENDGVGGGIGCAAFSTIVGNAIIGNSAPYCGSGITAFGATISNNTIANNGGSVAINCGGSATISNNIVAFNYAGIAVSSGTPTLLHNCVYNPDGANYTGLQAGVGDISVDPMLVATEYGQVHLQAGSPCVDAGRDAAVTSGQMDVDGESRIQGAHVDIGADEFNGVQPQFTPVVVRVSPGGDDGSDGSSWLSPKRTIQAGIDAVWNAGGGEVWVAEGVYHERVDLRAYVFLYGGFAGTENGRASRDLATRVTVLDGDAGGSVVTVLCGHRVNGLNGCTVRNGTGTLIAGYYRYGGGVYCSAASPILASNRISVNSASNGGGIYCYCSKAVISNSTISANTGDVGGILCEQSSPMVVNCTVVGNSASPSLVGGVSCDYLSSPTIMNTIIAFNSSGLYSGGGKPSLQSNCVFGNGAYNYYGVKDPTSTNGNISVDPKFANTPYGNVHLQSDSPCISAGDDSAVRSGWIDMDGQARLIGSHVDIGADESDGSAVVDGPYAVVRVSSEGDDANDGSSWTSTKRSVQAAINAAATQGGEVWVRSGIYLERISLRPYVHIFGGFAGTEMNRQQRDLDAYVSVLDGQAGGSVVSADTAGHLVSTIDGFVIRNGKADRGGGVYCKSASPRIMNSSITGNTASQGGGVFCNLFPMIVNSTIEANIAAKGGGIYCDSSSVPTVTGCAIMGNVATTGGAIYGYSSSPAVVGTRIVGNKASSGGGAYSYAGPPAFVNCTFSGNSAGTGAGLYLASSNVKMTNCIVWNNAGPSVTSISSNPVLAYCDIQGGWTGTGNINSDPRFVRTPTPGADNTWGTADDDYGDLRLQAGSPCVDAGNNSAVPVGILTDLAGRARFIDDPNTPDTGAGTAPIVDMGVYEAWLVPGDFNYDEVVDGRDRDMFAACLTGPAIPYAGGLPTGCSLSALTGGFITADFDKDGDVDQSDFGIFQKCFSGPDQLGDPNCAK